MVMLRSMWAAAALLVAMTGPVGAEVPMSGTVVATQACPALQSIRRQTNPDGAQVQPGTSYRALARNADPGTYVRVVVPGAQPAQRWVLAGCFGAAAQGGGAGPALAPATHVLALSWEKQFCQGHADKPECQVASPHPLSLHGLWPQPIGRFYCGVADRAAVAADKRSDWGALPEPTLSAQTRAVLAEWMPGVRSGLERHEWIKHGTCFGATPDAYFQRAAGLAAEVDRSRVAALLRDNAGQVVSAEAIRAAFDQSFGAGAGQRVTISCSRGPRPQIKELVLALGGDVAGSAPLGTLMADAAPVRPSCPGGVVAR